MREVSLCSKPTPNACRVRASPCLNGFAHSRAKKGKKREGGGERRGGVKEGGTRRRMKRWDISRYCEIFHHSLRLRMEEGKKKKREGRKKKRGEMA